MAVRLYPIGIQTFERIRKEDMLYIDKTEYVYRMTHTGSKFFFLSRPRRFGKSLLVSTFDSYFSGKKDLFNGLAIEKLETEWTEYPVLHFSMATAKHVDVPALKSELNLKLLQYEKIYGKGEGEENENQRLMGLIMRAFQKTGKQAVVLIDEYDAPLLDVAHEKTSLDALRQVMRNFYSPLKDCEPYLRFVFLTGITKFSQLSIFSELNNISNISMDDEYAGICGITKEELLTQMSEDIDVLAGAQGISREGAIAKLTEYYDGYHFSPSSPDVFNPYSLLNCFAKKTFGAYWFSSGTPTFLINMMRKFEVLPSEISRVEADESEFDAPTENMSTLMPLLYQSGYITIKDYDREFNYYTLDVPNKEVKVGLTKALIPYYVTQNTLVTTNTARRIAQCLVLKRDMDGALQLLKTFLDTVPYCDNTHYEGHYQQVLYIVFSLLTDYLAGVEVHTSNGRVDVVLLTRTDLYLIEIKMNKDARTAMQQINLNDYAKRFALCGKPIVKVGANFDSAKGTIEDWAIE